MDHHPHQLSSSSSYSFSITGISFENSFDPEAVWPAAVVAAASGDAFSIDDALHSHPSSEPAGVLAPMMGKTEAFLGDALKVLRAGAVDVSSCCWGGGGGGRESYSGRSLVAAAAVRITPPRRAVGVARCIIQLPAQVHCGLLRPGQQQRVFLTVLPGEREYAPASQPCAALR